jgi:CDP-diacylglycerol--glycerol-3-phosphate 3-phosphatidyltransferase
MLDKTNIPNSLTMTRIFAIPVLIVLHHQSSNTLWPFLLFTCIALTDFLDGYLARLWAATSKFGAFLDPAADKLLVLALLVVLAVSEKSLLFTVPAIVILFREFTMSMLREYLARIGKEDVVSVDKIGKVKTTVQFVALGLFLLPFQIANIAAYVCLYIAMFLTIFSFLNYCRKVIEAMSQYQTKNHFQRLSLACEKRSN